MLSLHTAGENIRDVGTCAHMRKPPLNAHADICTKTTFNSLHVVVGDPEIQKLEKMA